MIVVYSDTLMVFLDNKQTADTETDLNATDLVIMEDEPQAIRDEIGTASQLINLENAIKNYIKSLSSLRQELREKNSMLEDSFNNDTRYAQEEEKVKEATRVKATVKESILKQPGLVTVGNEIKEIRQKVKDQTDALGNYLKQYEEIAKTNQITTDDGEIHEIIVLRKLKKKSSKYNP